MKDTFISYLNSHNILVADDSLSVKRSTYSGYEGIFSVIDYALHEYGVFFNKGVELINASVLQQLDDLFDERREDSFYRGFPMTVKELSSGQIIIDRAVVYAMTYGIGNFDFTPESLYERGFKRNEKDKGDFVYKSFSILTEEEAYEVLAGYIKGLLSYTRPLNDTQLNVLTEYYTLTNETYLCVHNLTFKDIMKTVPTVGRDTAMVLLQKTGDVELFARSIGLLNIPRYVEHLICGKVIYTKNSGTWGNGYRMSKRMELRSFHLSSQERRQIASILDYLLKVEVDVAFMNICKLALEKRRAWKSILYEIHYKPKTESAVYFTSEIFGKSKSIASLIEKKIANGNMATAAELLLVHKGKNAVLRNIVRLIAGQDEATIQHILSMCDGSPILKMQIANGLCSRNESEARTFTFTAPNKTLKTHTETPIEQTKRKAVLSQDEKATLYKHLFDSIGNGIPKMYKTAYISESNKKVALPIYNATSKSGVGVLPTGSRLPIEPNKGIRAFTYWERVDDIDLSCFIICDDGKLHELSWRTVSDNRWVVYSGDVTTGYYHGGSEYFDFNIENIKHDMPDARYIVVCDNIYSRGYTYNSCKCKAGFMCRADLNNGMPYEPSTVKTSFKVSGDCTAVYLFAIDLVANEIVWLNVAITQKSSVAGTQNMDFLYKYFDIGDTFNHELIARQVAESVTENLDEADIIFADDVEVEGVPTIHSYDTEAVMELLTSNNK